MSHVPTVHIVEDDRTVLAALEQLFQNEGLPRIGYVSAEAFLAVATPDFAGCVLLDLALPGVNGLELQRLLLDSHILLPIVFLTGDATISQSVEAMKSGAFDFLLKPFDAEQLLERVRAAMEQDTARRGGGS